MNELISLSIYGEVLERTDTTIVCRDKASGQVLRLEGAEIRSNSADTFSEIRKVNKTEMAQTLLDACCDVFTVVFLKQGGETRTLRGRLIQSELPLGRVLVEDMDIDFGLTNIRQVDLRTIQSLILGGTKYVLK